MLKTYFPTSWLSDKSEFSRWKKMLTLVDLGSFFKISRIACRSLSRPVRVFSMLTNPPKCHIHQIKKIINSNDKI